jgi:hypothetical protein
LLSLGRTIKMREKKTSQTTKRQYGTNKSLHGQHVIRYYGQQTDSIDNTDVSKDSMDNTVLAKNRIKQQKE